MSAKPTLVLLHGVGLDRSMWEAQESAFQSTHRVVTYDLLGHGAESRRGHKLADWVGQLEEQVEALHVQTFQLLGFSFGGMIAQAYAAKHANRIDKLVLMSTVHVRSNTEREGVMARLDQATRQGPAAIIPAALARWFSPAASPHMLARYDALLRNNDEESFLAAYECFARGDVELEHALANFPKPTLVMTGERDTGSTPLMAQKLCGVIPHTQCYIVPGGQHMMPVEKPDDVNPVVAKFLEGARR